MLKQQEDRNCLLCSKALKGRSDKKFCDDYCRAAFNNELKSVANNFIRNVNNALGKNRRILEGFLPGGAQKAKVNREKLLQKGYQLKYHTHSYNNKNGQTYYYCYEYGYLPLENNWYLVVKRNEE